MTRQPLEILTEFKKTSVLDHLSPKEFKETGKHIRNIDATSPTLALDLLKAIPDVVYCPEHGALKNPAAYTNVFAQLRSISHGRFCLDPDSIAPHRWGIIYAINQTLAELDRDDRFYWIQYPDDGTHGPLRGWALIYLSYPQFKQLTQSKVLRLSAPFSWSNTRVDDLIAALERLGLLSHLSKAEIKKTRRGILDIDIGDRWVAPILDAFGLVCWIDAEMIYDINEDYKRLVAGTSRLSQGVFTPDKVRVGERDADQYFVLSFVYKGRTFSKRIERTLDWINWDYLVLMNSALASTGKDSRFYLVNTLDQTALIIFLSSDQLEEIRDKNLLPLDEAWDPISGYRGG